MNQNTQQPGSADRCKCGMTFRDCVVTSCENGGDTGFQASPQIAEELPPLKLPKARMLVGAHLDSLHTLYSAEQVQTIATDYARDAIAASRRAKRPMSPEIKAAIEEAHKTGATSAIASTGELLFINYGHDLGDNAHLECTACGGSGHIEDQKLIAASLPDVAMPELMPCLREVWEVATKDRDSLESEFLKLRGERNKWRERASAEREKNVLLQAQIDMYVAEEVAQTAHLTCAACGGTGYYSSGTTDLCEDCNGDGEVEVPAEGSAQVATSEQQDMGQRDSALRAEPAWRKTQTPCSVCKGQNYQCHHCDGMGIEPRKIDHYGDCRCVLSQYCDGKCNPVFADELATRCRAEGGNTCDKAACAIDALDGLGYRYDSEIGWLPPAAVVRAPAGYQPALMRQAVASVVSQGNGEFRVGWLRPERVQVGTLLYCATEPVAAEGATPVGDAQEDLARLECELSAILPGQFYMDEPGGGSVTLVEQLRRMARDATRFRWLNYDHDDPETRDAAFYLANRLATSSYFSITRDIDVAMKECEK